MHLIPDRVNLDSPDGNVPYLGDVPNYGIQIYKTSYPQTTKPLLRKVLRHSGHVP